MIMIVRPASAPYWSLKRVQITTVVFCLEESRDRNKNRGSIKTLFVNDAKLDF